MNMQGLLFEEDSKIAHKILSQLLELCPNLFIKKLSNNDRDWAQLGNKHQGGIYIPIEERDSGFFPDLFEKISKKQGSVIREARFETSWPQVPLNRMSRLVNYCSKGEETHLTGLPKKAFSEVSPASYFIMGKKSVEGKAAFYCLTIDSSSDDALFLEDFFELGPDFKSGIVDRSTALSLKRTRLLELADQIFYAWQAGSIAYFEHKNCRMPSTLELAELAREEYLKQANRSELNPYTETSPGDVIRKISREVERELFRNFQNRIYAVRLIRLIFGDDPREYSTAEMIKTAVEHIQEIDYLLMSASQQRKSRAGYSFELQIECMLEGGRIPFKKQVVVKGDRRPDFLLNSCGNPPDESGVIVLSAKTTLKERWKQVVMEQSLGSVFLATVDEKVAAKTLELMKEQGMQLVVPESLLTSKDTEYQRHSNVISFREFFDLPEVKDSARPK